MTAEEFRWIPGYEGLYEISNIGRLKDYNYKGKNGKRKPSIEIVDYKPNKTTGYISVILTRQDNKKRWGIHQLVAMAFLEHKPDGHKIVPDHINKIKTDNRLLNLRLLTARENTSRQERNLPTGVSWHKLTKKYRSQIRIKGKKKIIGHFLTIAEAYEAYQNELKKLIEK